jgi:hypothetical protein
MKYISMFCCAILIIVSFGNAADSKQAAPSAAVKFTSAYSNLEDPKECHDAFDADEVEEGGDMPIMCKGYGDYIPYIYFSAINTMLSIIKVRSVGDDLFIDDDSSVAIGTLSSSEDTTPKISRKSTKVEWRLANGKPFAVIVRLPRFREGDWSVRIGEELVVQGLDDLKSFRVPIDTKKEPNANVRARELADERYLDSIKPIQQNKK